MIHAPTASATANAGWTPVLRWAPVGEASSCGGPSAALIQPAERGGSAAWSDRFITLLNPSGGGSSPQPGYADAIAQDNALRPSPTPVPYWALQQAVTAIQAELDRLSAAELARRGGVGVSMGMGSGCARDARASGVGPGVRAGPAMARGSVETIAGPAARWPSVGGAASPFSMVVAPAVPRIGLRLDVLA